MPPVQSAGIGIGYRLRLTTDKGKYFVRYFLRYPWGMISVVVRVYDLEVEIQSSESFPDHLDDLCNRATKLFAEAVDTMKMSNIALTGEDLIDGEEQG